jgi:hypothetical protein
MHEQRQMKAAQYVHGSWRGTGCAAFHKHHDTFLESHRPKQLRQIADPWPAPVAAE